MGNMGNLGAKEFDHITCQLCVEKVLLKVISDNKGELPENPSLVDVMSMWDHLKIAMTMIDLVGCLIPHEKYVFASPNGRRFIKRPETHDLHEKVKGKVA